MTEILNNIDVPTLIQCGTEDVQAGKQLPASCQRHASDGKIYWAVQLKNALNILENGRCPIH